MLPESSDFDAEEMWPDDERPNQTSSPSPSQPPDRRPESEHGSVPPPHRSPTRPKRRRAYRPPSELDRD
jgi:hypothetical protein